MVGHTRGTADTRRIRRLKQSQPLEVETDAEGVPLRVQTAYGHRAKGDLPDSQLAGLPVGAETGWHDVTLARRPWRIDQHWWRGEVVSRVYYRVAPADGPPLTIYHDLISGQWARQEY